MLRTTIATSLTEVRRHHTALAAAAGLLGITVIIALSASAQAAQFTPPNQNGQIAFTRDDGGGAGDIFVMNPDGSGQTNLTPGTATEDLQPSYSPDGQTIVFNRLNDIFSMSATGANPTNLTNGQLGFQPTFTPAGTKIVFSRNDPPNQPESDIFIMNPNGSGAVSLTGGSPADDQNPNVSPDGTKIIFGSTRDGGDFDIFSMNINGSNPVNLTPTNTTADNNAYFSPNGQQIAFQRVVAGQTDVFVMNADGSGATNLTNDPAAEGQPAFSPDGTKISYTRVDGGDQDVFVMNADGSDKTNLTPGNATSDREAEWQPIPLAGQGQCIVPDVVGLKKGKAKKAIVAANCTVGTTKKKFSKKVKKKKVIKSKPKAGTTLPAGSTVDLKDSKGKKKG